MFTDALRLSAEMAALSVQYLEGLLKTLVVENRPKAVKSVAVEAGVTPPFSIGWVIAGAAAS